ncbi:unnamed protein product [Eruca vesicaria subsp. sativa]|uniref:Hydrophobic seed protein domain-containing protein n=1 Tax=Eruca vesicaria subsp. sativa TaxID=29727 RepID=A0ABC8LWB3_ERUVS|nr:unnamed protein product [Eruca vesicaria subsp. sativa]
MASKIIAIILAVNIVFFTMANAVVCPDDEILIPACAYLLLLANVEMSIELSPSPKPCCDAIAGLTNAIAGACLCDANLDNSLHLANVSVAVTAALKKCGHQSDIKCSN